MNEDYLKTLHGPGQYFRLFGSTFKAMSGLGRIPKDERVPPSLTERITLAVSGVNECEYCSWLHSKKALELGFSEKDVENMLRGDLSGLNRAEAAAVLYAQHWADTDGNVSTDARKGLEEFWTEGAVRSIEAFIVSAYFGNLCSNTVVAFQNGAIPGRFRPGMLLTYLLSLPVAAVIRKKAS